MLSPTENVLFGSIFTLAVVIFIMSTVRLIRLILLGGPDSRLKGQFWKRTLSMLEYAFLQKRVISERYGLNHFVIFWGFIVLLFANIEFVLAGLFPDFAFQKVFGATL